MSFFKRMINKFAVFMGVKKNETFTTQPQTIEQNQDLNKDIEIKKLNSRISLLTQKMEEMQASQSQVIVFLEQILFHTSGSFEEEMTFDNNEKKLVQIKVPYKLN